MSHFYKTLTALQRVLTPMNLVQSTIVVHADGHMALGPVVHEQPVLRRCDTCLRWLPKNCTTPCTLAFEAQPVRTILLCHKCQ